MKKVLIITYHWPPSGGITVLRCLKIAKYLRDFGWEPIVFTAKNASYQYLDFSNEKDIPLGVEIHQVPIFEPINVFKKISGRKKSQPLQNFTTNSDKKKSFIDKLGLWVRGNFFIPDARYRWITPSINYLEKYLKKNTIDAIFTDGPPHTNTVIGMKIAQKFNIPWIADFQDPWTQVDYYSKMYIGKRADKKHKALEQEVFQTAKKITIASPSWKLDLESIGAKNVDVIYYGYDESDFKNYTSKTPEKFTIFHGGLLGEDRNPDLLFKAIYQILESNPSFQDKIEIRLAGEIDHSVKQTITKYILNRITNYLGMISRENVISEYANSSLLILPINKAINAKGRIPGKLFEILRSNKPVLVLGPENGDVKKIVEQKEKGISIEYNNFLEIENFLSNAIFDNTFMNFNPNSIIEEFSNRSITSKLAEYLDDITNKTT